MPPSYLCVASALKAWSVIMFVLDLSPLLCHTICVGTIRTHVLLPEDLVREIDALVGPRGRSAFIVATARDAVRRKRLLEFLNSEQLVWKDEDHPEFANGSAQWVQKIRRESDRASRRRRKRRS